MAELTSFGTLVREAREAKGWRRADLRRALEDHGTSVSHTTIRLWEQDSCRPTVENLSALVDVLAQSAEEAEAIDAAYLGRAAS